MTDSDEPTPRSHGGRRRVGGRWFHLTGVAMLLLAACGSSSSTTSGSSSTTASQSGSGSASSSGCSATFKIVYASPLPNSADWKRSADYLNTWASSHCAQVTVNGPADTVDIPTIINNIQQAINNHPDMILTCACAGGVFDAPLKKAKDAGIVVVTLAADSATDSRNVFLGTNYDKLAQTAAQALIQKTGGNAKIAVIQQNGTVANQVEELKAFKAAIASTPGMQVVTQLFDNSDAATAQSQISQLLTTHPEVNTIWTLEGISPGVIEPTLKAAGKQPGDITVLGIDLQPPVKQAIQDGYIWGTVYQQFFDATPVAADCAVKVKAGQSISSDVLDTGTLVISKDNLPSTLPPQGETLPSC